MFKENFELQLQKKNVKPYEVSKATGISQGLLSEYKSGKKQPSIPSLQKLADYFGCSVGDLVGNEKAPPKNDEASLQPIAPHEQELLNYIRSRPPEEQPAACQDAEAFLRFRAEKK